MIIRYESERNKEFYSVWTSGSSKRSAPSSTSLGHGGCPALGVTQPAVSARSRKLEESSASRLFERAGGRLKPTPEGLLFYAEASRVLGEVDRLAATTAQIREGQSGRLVIASHPARGDLAAAAAWSRPSSPSGRAYRCAWCRATPTWSASSCRPKSYDLGIAELPVDETAVRLMRFQMRCVAILPPRHALASRKLLTPALLSGQPMVAPARSPQMLSRVYGTFAGAGCADQRGGRGGVLRQPAARWWRPAPAGRWSIPCRRRASAISASSTRPFEPAVIYEIGVFHRRDREPSVLAAAFLELLESKLGSAR